MSDDKTEIVSAEDWGRIAVSLPGWRWMPGMRIGGEVSDRHKRVGDHWHMRSAMLDPRRAHAWPDPDDPATAGCLLVLLGDRLESVDRLDDGFRVMWFSDRGRICSTPGFVSVGRACIAAAEALGRWPGGEG